jgi:hypothetical protein
MASLWLHAEYGQAQVAALLGQEVQSVCDGQLLVTSDRVVWLASGPAGTFPTPTCFEWRDEGLQYVDGTTFWSLPVELGLKEPEMARDVSSRTFRGSGARVPRVLELLAQPSGSSSFVYLGKGHLGMFWCDRQAPFGRGSVTLDHKLPSDLWVRLGGYEGWSATVEDERHVGLTDEQAAALVEEHLGADARHVRLTRWQEDSLTLLLNPERAFVMYLTRPGDPGVQACDLNWLRSDKTATFTCSCYGIPLTFDYAMTIPKQLAGEVAGHYLRTGTLAEWVPWHYSLDGLEPDPEVLIRFAEHTAKLRAARGELPIPGILDYL